MSDPCGCAECARMQAPIKQLRAECERQTVERQLLLAERQRLKREIEEAEREDRAAASVARTRGRGRGSKP